MKNTLCYFLIIFAFVTIKNQFLAQNGDLLFDNSIVHQIRLKKIDTLTFFQFVNKGNYVMADLTIDGVKIDSIGIATKGNISWNSEKKPLKIKLNEYVKGKQFDGIKKFYLHNSYQDPSQMREKLTYDVCREMGLYALRTAYAEVYIEDVYFGLYTLIEAKDELYKREFKNKNLEAYETYDFGSPCFFSQEDIYWEVTNGEPDLNWSRLQKLTTILTQTPHEQYMDTVRKYFNLDDFITYQAINVYLLNYDSYVQNNGNQIYAYDSIIEKRFQVIPWDFNASFGLWNNEHEGPNEVGAFPAEILNKCPSNRITSVPELKKIYLDAMCKLTYEICDSTLFNMRISNQYELIKESVRRDWRIGNSFDDFTRAVHYGYNGDFANLMTFTNERWLKMDAQLALENYRCNLKVNDAKVNTESYVLYPNPASGYINIYNSMDIVSVEIFNIAGQLELREIINDSLPILNIDIHKVKAGSYIIRATSNNGNQKIEHLLIHN